MSKKKTGRQLVKELVKKSNATKRKAKATPKWAAMSASSLAILKRAKEQATKQAIAIKKTMDKLDIDRKKAWETFYKENPTWKGKDLTVDLETGKVTERASWPWG